MGGQRLYTDGTGITEVELLGKLRKCISLSRRNVGHVHLHVEVR